MTTNNGSYTVTTYQTPQDDYIKALEAARDKLADEFRSVLEENAQLRRVAQDHFEERGIAIDLLRTARLIMKADGCYACAFPKAHPHPQDHFHASSDRASIYRTYFGSGPTQLALMRFIDLIVGPTKESTNG